MAAHRRLWAGRSADVRVEVVRTSVCPSRVSEPEVRHDGIVVGCAMNGLRFTNDEAAIKERSRRRIREHIVEPYIRLWCWHGEPVITRMQISKAVRHAGHEN